MLHFFGIAVIAMLMGVLGGYWGGLTAVHVLKKAVLEDLRAAAAGDKAE